MNFLFKKYPKKMNYLTLILLSFLIIYLLIATLTFFFQRNLLYNPNENNYSNDQLLVPLKKIKIKTQDNIELISWYHKKNVNTYKTILFLHGNAGSLENRIHKINHFQNINVNFLLIAWRGFSGNKGNPTEEGLYKDARSAVEWLNSIGVYEKDIIIYGESLGTGVACEIAQNKKIEVCESHIDINTINDFDEAFITSSGIGVLECYWDGWKSNYTVTKKIKKVLAEKLTIWLF